LPAEPDTDSPEHLRIKGRAQPDATAFFVGMKRAGEISTALFLLFVIRPPTQYLTITVF
jgi:hypothetical protein